jgi:hypothetical protein
LHLPGSPGAAGHFLDHCVERDRGDPRFYRVQFAKVLAYTLLAACAAAAAVIVFIDSELLVLTSVNYEIVTPSVSPKAKGAISMGILAFSFLAFSAAISSQRLRA